MVGGVLLCSCHQVLMGAVAVWLVEFSCAAVTKSLMEAIAVWLVEFSCAAVNKSLMEVVAV